MKKKEIIMLSYNFSILFVTIMAELLKNQDYFTKDAINNFIK